MKIEQSLDVGLATRDDLFSGIVRIPSSKFESESSCSGEVQQRVRAKTRVRRFTLCLLLLQLATRPQSFSSVHFAMHSLPSRSAVFFFFSPNSCSMLCILAVWGLLDLMVWVWDFRVVDLFYLSLWVCDFRVYNGDLSIWGSDLSV
eukprot:TRINITY_DN3276_c0_g1_i1.p1 TRINITY_DN3276_c0_g1~~TRINITY_DN3276_c0_g1_i1.p1  ORF type:complete len:146 (+),score=16.72 TRINITY_DN3276_c0_g1_i1:448-885(+)